jgi:ArsR family transcriptional regulator
MALLTTADFLVTLAEPTRLRVLNCIAAAPLFVSDLVAVLGLPQPTVSRHLRVLRELEVVRDLPLPPFVLYQFAPPGGPRGRLLRSMLEAVRDDGPFAADRLAARERSRSELQARVARTDADAG